MDDDEPAIFSEEVGQESENAAHESDTEAVETPSTSATPDAPSTGHVRGSTPCDTFRSHSSSRKRKLHQNDDKTIEVMTLLGKKLESLQTDDSFDVFGKHVANKLRTLNTQQNVFTQKLINSVLFEAEMESLTRSFKVADLGETQYHFGSTRGHYGWQQNMLPQIGQYQHLPWQIGRPHQVPQQIGQQQQMPQGRPNIPSETDSSCDTNSTLVTYFTNFEDNN